MKRLLLVLGSLALPAGSVAAQSTMRLAVGQDSRLWIEGTSNVSAWSCKATNLDAEIEVELGFREAADFPRFLKSVQVKVPVAELKCGHDQMDKNLRKALRADDSTDIKYVTATFDAVSGAEGSGYVIHTIGTLTLAGRENPVQMDVDATRRAAGGLQAHGEVPILMTEYGIKPPTAMFGAIRTGDRVVVKFDLVIGPEVLAVATTLSGAAAR